MKKSRLRIGCFFLASIVTMMGLFTGCNKEKIEDISNVSSDISGSDIPGDPSNTDIGESSSAVSTSGGSSDASVTNTGSVNTSKTQSSGTTGGKTLNLNGRKLTFVVQSSSSDSESPFTTTDGYLYKSFRETEKKYNCTIEVKFMDYLQATEQIQKAHLSGVPYADVFEMSGYEVAPSYAASGMFLPISDYVTLSDSVWVNTSISQNGSWNGKRYGLPYSASSAIGIFYNKTLLAEANVPDLWTYVENNTWNWTTFKDICSKLTKDADGDGAIDQFAFVDEEVYSRWILTNNANVITYKNGQGNLSVGSDNSLAAIDFVNSLIDANYIPTDTQINQFASSQFQCFPTGCVAMFPYGLGYAGWLIEKGMKSSEFGWVWFPKGPNATSYVSPGLTDSNCFMVPTIVKNPEEVCTVLADALAFWSPSKTNKYSLDDVANEIQSDDVYVEFLLNANYKKLYFDGRTKFVNTNMYSYMDALGQIREMFGKMRSKELTPKAAVDSYKDNIEAIFRQTESQLS